MAASLLKDDAMRGLVVAILAAAGFAASFPNVAVAADAAVPRGCGPGTVWDGYECVAAAPQVRRVEPAPEFYEEEPVYEAPPVYAREVYVAPPVYAAAPVYVVPRYRPPVVRYYAGPRYVAAYRPYRRDYVWRR
jgi:hypothetical protein